LYLGKKESLVEQKRQKLAHVSDFSPEHLFSKVSTDGNKITGEDLLRFCNQYPEEQKISLTIDMCHLTIKFWEQKIDQGYLNISDFTNMVLPHDNSMLRANVM
jgi:hypothetical protein